jgi:DNA-directed RNA polymerase subunit omega
MSMLRPAVSQIIGKNQSTYSLCIGVAKRARDIADYLYEHEEQLDEKPVKTSIDELYEGKYKIAEG